MNPDWVVNIAAAGGFLSGLFAGIAFGSPRPRTFHVKAGWFEYSRVGNISRLAIGRALRLRIGDDVRWTTK